MESILNAKEKPIVNDFCEFINMLTPEQQEKLYCFIQSYKFWQQQQLQPTGA